MYHHAYLVKNEGRIVIVENNLHTDCLRTLLYYLLDSHFKLFVRPSYACKYIQYTRMNLPYSKIYR